MKMAGKTVILIIAKGFTDPELWYPYYRFLEEGAEAIIAAPEKGSIRGEAGPYDHTMAGWAADATHTIEEAAQMPFDVLFLVGGVFSPMYLRNMKSVQGLVRKSVESGKLTCAVCHAPQILISAEVVKGKKISCPSDMAIDITNAGGIYVEDPAVLDGNLLTSTSYRTLPEMFRLLMKNV